jgi:hypothetical protein
VKSTGGYKVKIVIGDATVEVEGAETGVVKIVEAVSDVLRGSRKPSGSFPVETIPSPPAIHSSSARSTAVDIRSFFEAKAPSSDVEAATVAAYYYKYVASESEHRETINAAQLQEAFRLARWPLPRQTRFTLQNARNAGYLDASGEGGQYRINPVGYNLVEHALGRTHDLGKEKVKPRKQKAKRRT